VNQQKRPFLFAAFILFAINILNFYDRHVPGALVEPMRKEFHLTDTQVGLLSSVFIWLYAIVGLPLGWVADRWSRKKLLAAGVVVWSSLTALAALATSYPMLVFSRLGVGLGEAACAPTATSWLGDLFPQQKRSRALAIFMLGVPIGGALSFFFSGSIAQAHGWRVAMVLAAAPALLLVPALLFLHEPERGASETHQTRIQRTSMWEVLRIPTFWWIIASGALLNFNLYALGTFLPAFFARVHHLTLARSGYATGLVYLVGGLSGGLLAGHLGDAIVERRKDGRMLIAATAALVSVPLAALGVLQQRGAYWAAGLFFTLAYATLVMYYGPVYSAIQDIVAPRQRGTSMAIYFMAMYMCGASFGPLFTGKLSDWLAHRAAALAGSGTVAEAFKAVGLQQAMLVVPVLSFALAIVLYAGSRMITRDMQTQEATAQALAVSSD
jgi:predicted MFS family arabinose efflux permease